MAETHELRLKINAAAAKAGSREFVGAIASIKKAVTDLDRASDGTFRRLSKNAKEAGKAANMKIQGVDRAAINSLDQFSKLQSQTIRQASTARKGIDTLVDGIRNLSAAYGLARASSESFIQSISRGNTALSRQAALAMQAAAAARSANSRGSTVTTPAPNASGQAANQQISLQNRVKRAVDDTRLSVERLTTQLMKVGGFSQIQQVGAAYRAFQKELSNTALTASQLDAAKTRLNTALRNGQTAVVTLTTKLQDEARAARESAAAAASKARAEAEIANAAKQAASATAAATAAQARQQAVSISSAAAMRQASEEAARLSERLRRIGDTRGLAAVNVALNALRSNMGAGVSTATQLRAATGAYADSLSRVKIGLAQAEGAQARAAASARILARQQADAASSALRVEREMRSISGAASAASRAMREATGSMRGLENAFNATFQIGSAFRVMLGSLTLGSFTQSVFAAGAALEQFSVSMQVSTGSMAGAADEIDFIDGMARNLGISLRGAREDFGKFAISANLAGVETETTRDIFESVAMAMSVIGRGAEDQRLAFLALEQMLSKNVVSSEELRRQLGERLPGAVNLMARAVGVSTAELQKMLKAGSLISSEVLPLFAREVRAAFGPGLEAATQRASFSLGTVRVEFEKLLEIVANSGFMDVVARQFRNLTEALRSEQITEVATKLGEGLGKLAEMTLNFGRAFVDNMDTIAAVAKAVIGGLIVRQVILAVNAFMTMGQRAAVSYATLVGAMTRSTTATVANTTATNLNTTANAANARSAAAVAAGATASAAAHARNAAAAGIAAGANARAGISFAATGAAALTFARGLGTVTRILGGLAGPIGIALTALTLIPLAFGSIENDAGQMASAIENAVRRSGESFDSLGQSAVRASSSVELTRVLDDINTLNGAVGSFIADNTQGVRALRTLMGELVDPRQLRDWTGLTSPDSRTAIDAGALSGGFADAFGDGSLVLGDFATQTRTVISDMSALTLAALRSGEGFVTLRDQIASAIAANPSAAPILTQLAAFTEELALSEIALISNRERLVELYGTADDRIVKTFADAGRAVVNTGQGLEDLRDRMAAISGESPQVREQLESVVRAVEDALNTGGSTATYRVNVLPLFGGAALAIEDLRTEAARAEEAATASATAFATTVASTLSGLDGTQLFNSDGLTQAINDIATLSSEYEKFQDFSVAPERLASMFADFEFPTQESEDYTNSLLRQFNALPAARQTYSELNTILESLGASFPTLDASAFEDSLRNIIRTGQQNSLSTADYVTSLRALQSTMTDVSQISIVQGLIDAAEANGRLQDAARGASVAVTLTSESMREANRVAGQGNAAVNAYRETLDAIGLAAEGMASRLSSALGDTQERLNISSLSGEEAAIAQYFASFGEGGKLVAEVTAEIDALRTQARAAIIDGGLSPQDGPARGLLAGVEEREAALQLYIDQQTRLQRAIYRAGQASSAGPDPLTAALTSVNAQLPRLSTGSQVAVNGIMGLFNAAQQSGTGFVELQSQIEQTIANVPSAAPVLEQLSSIVAQAARAELALIDQRRSTVDAFEGTNGSILSDFAQLGEQVLSGGASMDELYASMREVTRESPHLRSGVTSIFEEVNRAFSAGEGVDVFKSRIIDIVDASGAALARLRAEVMQTQQAADAASATFASTTANTLAQLSVLSVSNAETGGIGISDEDIARLTQMTAEFQRLSEASFSVDQLVASVNTLTFPNEETRAFTEELMRQFAALPAAEQTYANLSGLAQRLGSSLPIGQSSEFVAQLQQTIYAASGAENATNAYISALEDVRDSLPLGPVRDLVDGMLEAARAKQTATSAAYASVSAFNAAGGAALAAGQNAQAGAAGFYAIANAASAAFSAIAAAQGQIRSGLAAAQTRVQREIEIAGMGERDAFIARSVGGEEDRISGLIADARSAANNFGPNTIEGIGARARLAELESEAQGVEALRTSYGTLFDAQAINDAASSSSGGGSGSRTEKLNAEAQALKALQEGFKSRLQSLNAENAALAMLTTGMTTSESAARLLAEAQVQGVTLTDAQTEAFFRQIEAAEALNAQLTQLANDPVNAWMSSVPSWLEAGRTIEEGAIKGLSSALSTFVQTGKFDIRSLGLEIVNSAIEIISDKAVKTLIGILGGNTSGTGTGGFGFGQLLNGIFGSGDESPAVPADTGGSTEMLNAMSLGGNQAGQIISQAITSSGGAVASQISSSLAQGANAASGSLRTGVATGGATAAANVKSSIVSGGFTASSLQKNASVTGARSLGQGVIQGSQQGASILAQGVSSGASGGGGGGFLGTLLSFLPFANGGVSNRPTNMNAPVVAPAALLSNIPHYAKGTPNTSGGIPAILHDNEAVVPLSGGRKIPVELSNQSNGSAGSSVINLGGIEVTVKTEQAIDNPELAAQMATKMVDMIKLNVSEQLAVAAQYGGALNPRGRGQ